MASLKYAPLVLDYIGLSSTDTLYCEFTAITSFNSFVLESKSVLITWMVSKAILSDSSSIFLSINRVTWNETIVYRELDFVTCSDFCSSRMVLSCVTLLATVSILVTTFCDMSPKLSFNFLVTSLWIFFALS